MNKLMGNSVNVILLHLEDIVSDHSRLHHRLVRLEDNEFIKPLLDDCDDPVLKDILDIPSVCANIQDDWLNVGLNRMTAWHLGKCVQKRLQDHVGRCWVYSTSLCSTLALTSNLCSNASRWVNSKPCGAY